MHTALVYFFQGYQLLGNQKLAFSSLFLILQSVQKTHRIRSLLLPLVFPPIHKIFNKMLKKGGKNTISESSMNESEVS
jgi:hypothetical protein